MKKKDKKKQCTQCHNWFKLNSFNGNGICAKCISIEEARELHIEANRLRYEEITAQGIGNDDLLFSTVWGEIFKNGTFGQTAKVLGVNRGLVHKVAMGGDSPKLRKMFCLPSKKMLTEPCECGEVHKFKTCPKKRKPQKIDRLAASLTKEEGRDARKIIDHMGLGSVTEFWRWYIKQNAKP